jgi:hypothetical protein
MRRHRQEPERERIDFFGYSEREADLYVELIERHGLSLVDVHEAIRKEVGKQMNATEEDHEGATRNARG